MKPHWALALLLVCSSSYSDIIYGTTPNAAGNGVWSMTNVLPKEAGVQVDQVFYQYTAVKNPADDMTVTVQNEDAIRGGTIFKETDDWSQKPGTTINKIIPVPSIPSSYWGQGSISTTGVGQVTDPKVVYSYKYDTCANPLSDPMCPGYNDAMLDYVNSLGLDQGVDVRNPYDDEAVQNVLNNKVNILDMKEDEEEDSRNKDDSDEDEEQSLEEKLSIANTAVMNSQAIAQAAQFDAMSVIPNFNAYYRIIPGGVYKENVTYRSDQLQESKSAKRVGLAQQILHTKMVEQQYKDKK